jgi:hypothetical protein
MLFACTEKINIDVDDAPAQLVIYGHITTDTMQHAITVSRSLNYFENARPEGISNATVTVRTDNETYVLHESPDAAGTYLTDPGVFGIEGKTYTLNVSVEFNGVSGEYEASSVLPHSIRMDSVDFRPSPLGSYVIDVLLYGRLPESEHNYLNVQAFKNGAAINGKLADFSIIASENRTEKEINGEQCLYLFRKNNNSERFNNLTPVEDGDSVRIQVGSITKEYAEYVKNAQKELQGSIPVFSGPPANIKSNIRTVRGGIEACGFFTAYSKQSSIRVFNEKN